MSKFRITFNSPVILVYSFFCFIIFYANSFVRDEPSGYFILPGTFDSSNPVNYFQLFSYVLGHGSTGHLFGNLSFILLLGPILEERYGSKQLSIMFLITALSTAILHIILFDNAVLGASGIVFMLIVLSSFVNVREGEIPMTFILVVLIFLGKEVMNSFTNDNVSQFAHILGGVLGSIFGFGLRKPKKSPDNLTSL